MPFERLSEMRECYRLYIVKKSWDILYFNFSGRESLEAFWPRTKSVHMRDVQDPTNLSALEQIPGAKLSNIIAKQCMTN